MMMTTKWSLRSHCWTLVTLTLHRHKRDLWHFICHTQRAATLSGTFYFFCFIDHREIQVLHSWEDLERYLFRTRRKWLLYLETSLTKIYSSPISLYLILVNIPFRVSCWAVLRTWVPRSCFSLWAGGLISSRGSEIPTSWHDNVRTLWELRAHCLTVLVFFANIYKDLFSHLSLRDGAVRGQNVCVMPRNSREINGGILRPLRRFNNEKFRFVIGQWVLSLESKHGNKQRMDERHGRSFKNLIN